MPLSNSSDLNGSWLNHTLFKTMLAIVLTGCAAWGAYVNSQINQIADLKTQLAVIEQKLDDISKEIHAQRHNP